MSNQYSSKPYFFYIYLNIISDSWNLYFFSEQFLLNHKDRNTIFRFYTKYTLLNMPLCHRKCLYHTRNINTGFWNNTKLNSLHYRLECPKEPKYAKKRYKKKKFNKTMVIIWFTFGEFKRLEHNWMFVMNEISQISFTWTIQVLRNAHPLAQLAQIRFFLRLSPLGLKTLPGKHKNDRQSLRLFLKYWKY